MYLKSLYNINSPYTPNDVSIMMLYPKVGHLRKRGNFADGDYCGSQWLLFQL